MVGFVVELRDFIIVVDDINILTLRKKMTAKSHVLDCTILCMRCQPLSSAFDCYIAVNYPYSIII